MEDLVRVKDVPPAVRGGSKVDWERVTQEAREHPDEWVLVPQIMHVSVASNIRRGQYKGIDPAEFEVTVRKTVEDGKKDRVHLYVKAK